MKFLPLFSLLLVSAIAHAGDERSNADIRTASTPVTTNGRVVQSAAVFVNGNAVAFDTPLQMHDGRIYVPLRAISEAAGALVRFNSRTGRITIQRGESVVLYDPPASSARVLVPLRFVGETLGATLAVGKNNGVLTVDMNWPDGNFQSQTAQPPLPATPETNESGDIAASIRYNLTRLNAYRARSGAPALKLDAKLNAFARQGSVELKENHQPHGHFQRAKVFDEGFEGGAAENQGDSRGWPIEGGINATIDAILQAMIDEGPGGGHHDNMLNPKYKRVGVGLIVDGDKLYFTNDFSG